MNKAPKPAKTIIVPVKSAAAGAPTTVYKKDKITPKKRNPSQSKRKPKAATSQKKKSKPKPKKAKGKKPVIRFDNF